MSVRQLIELFDGVSVEVNYRVPEGNFMKFVAKKAELD